ncbi:Tat pathway signal sequence domain protein [Wenjunlia vitaminophila]|uniref:Tat pathway signal sequence domain protein n=1 Tax=Wenjunlia vitaminophila TaxID=76728 RepID=A0A0T6LZ25_WENVI|nr:alkaline phosphatase PhoX [Wenjunlia vitaminophila]KRV51364.1 Tat pathway signal sequence domain protein [Wenjunlia vitaminophila]
MSVSRRHLLAGAGALGAGITFTGALDQLFVGHAAAAEVGGHSGYGPLVPDPAGLLDLPRGFSYQVLSREGEPLLSGEGPVPSNHDGMAAFLGRAGHTYLVRNHENRPRSRVRVPAIEGLTYDPAAEGGCTVLELDHTGRPVDERVGIAGTGVNCSGGPTPWNTWLTCEETEDKAGVNGYTKDHGFIFEVDPRDPHRSGAHPLTAMGRFQHEAVAVDPTTGVVYETEDAFAKPFGLYYRFLPNKPRGGPGSLRAGGELQAMRVPGVPDLSVVQEAGTSFDDVEWVPVPDPLAAQTPIRLQDFGPGGITHAQKLEGAYWGNGRSYFVSSFARTKDGSRATHFGQVWSYNPRSNRLTLEVVFGPDTDTQMPGESPDNIALSPNGGLMVCEDGGGDQYVYGVSRTGMVYPMARGRQNLGTPESPDYGEFAGVAFSPDGRTMYVNCYTPGTTFAVTGPWRG